MLLIDPAFWNQSIDVILYDLLTWFGWIPLTVTIASGMAQVWKNHRQGLFAGTLKFVILAIDVPSMTEQTPKAVENIFTTIAGAYSNLTWKEIWVIGKFQPSFSFEIVSTEGYVQFYVRVQTKYRDAIEAGIYAHYPDAEIAEVEDYTNGFPTHFPNETHEAWGAELTLKEKQYFPIRTYADFEDPVSKEYKDPLGQILEQLAKMRPGEHYWIQILCQVTNNKWKDEGVAFINKTYGVEEHPKEGGLAAGMRTLLSIPDAVLAKTLGINLTGMLLGAPAGHKEEDQWRAFKLTEIQREQTKAVLEKIGKPGMLAKIRSVYIARKEAYNKGARILFIKGMFNQYAHLGLNSIGFSPLTIPKDDYFWQKWSYATKQTNLVTGYVKRDMGRGGLPKIFNAEELATLWHFPAIGTQAPLTKKTESKRGEPPTGLPIGLETDDVVAQGVARSAAAARQKDAAPAAHGLPSGDVVLPRPSIAAPAPHHPPEPEEEVELGLDATDMGPPADVILPGPPAHLKEQANAPVEDRDNDGSHEGAPPPNLPV